MTTEEADGIVNHVSSGLFWLWKGSMQSRYYFFAFFEQTKHKGGHKVQVMRVGGRRGENNSHSPVASHPPSLACKTQNY